MQPQTLVELKVSSEFSSKLKEMRESTFNQNLLGYIDKVEGQIDCLSDKIPE